MQNFCLLSGHYQSCQCDYEAADSGWQAFIVYVIFLFCCSAVFMFSEKVCVSDSMPVWAWPCCFSSGLKRLSHSSAQWSCLFTCTIVHLLVELKLSPSLRHVVSPAWTQWASLRAAAGAVGRGQLFFFPYKNKDVTETEEKWKANKQSYLATSRAWGFLCRWHDNLSANGTARPIVSLIVCLRPLHAAAGMCNLGSNFLTDCTLNKAERRPRKVNSVSGSQRTEAVKQNW